MFFLRALVLTRFAESQQTWSAHEGRGEMVYLLPLVKGEVQRNIG
jgi:hypothetical protein